MPPSRKQPSYDVEEVLPNRFVIRNPRAKGVLKSEGQFQGQLFELTSWRREGLLARLETHGFTVITLRNRIMALPRPPAPPSIGEFGRRTLASPQERYSCFDPQTLRWTPIDSAQHEGAPSIALRSGWILRRRKGRGPSAYYLAVGERGGAIGLKALDETEALIAGYAQAAAQDPPPLLARRLDGKLLLPDIELPRPYREFLRRIGEQTDTGVVVEDSVWPLARELFGRLGLALEQA